MNCNKICRVFFALSKVPESFHDNGVGMKGLALKRELEGAKKVQKPVMTMHTRKNVDVGEGR